VVTTFTWKIFSRPLLGVRLSETEGVDLALLGLSLALFMAAAVLYARGRHRPALRRVTQTLSLVLLGLLFPLCLCVTKGVGVTVQKLTAGEFLVSLSYLWLPLLVIGFVVFLGRGLYCNWICPLGFVQDMVGKIHSFKKARLSDRALRVVDLAALIVALLGSAAIMWLFRPTPFIVGAGAVLGLVVLTVCLVVFLRPTLKARFARLSYFIMATWIAYAFYVFFSGMDSASGPWCVIANANLGYAALIPFAGIIVAAAVIPRAWCRYVCPDGALLQLLRGKPRQDALD
jgi:polyferredoxin